MVSPSSFSAITTNINWQSSHRGPGGYRNIYSSLLMYGVPGGQPHQRYPMSSSQQPTHQPYSHLQAPPHLHQGPMPGNTASLIQPPALASEEQPQGHGHYFQGRAAMAMSNNQHSEFEAYPHPDEEGNWGPNEAHIASMFWEQRCGTLLERFDWFFDRFEILKNEYGQLSEEMQRMDSEEEWHLFQQHHDQFHEKLEEMEQELSTVLAENEQLMQQRRNQDSESVWEQRYQELLGNFKSLEAAGGVSVEQYRTLQEHYNELEYQYGEAMNEIHKVREEGGSAEAGELDSYKDKVNALHNQNVELQNMLGDLEQQCLALKQAQQDPSQIQELMNALHEKDQAADELRNQLSHRPEGHQVEEMIRGKEAEISQYQEMLAARERDMMALQEQLSQAHQSLNQTNPQIEEQLQEMQTEINHLQHYQAEAQQLQEQIETMQESVAQMEREIRNLEQEVSSQQHLNSNAEKKLSYASKEVDNLHEALRKKNEEVIALRGDSYELDRLRQERAELARTVEERDQLLEKIRRVSVENEQLKKNQSKMARKLEEASNPRKEFNLRALRTEVEHLNQQTHHLEAQLQRSRTSTKLKDDYAHQLEEELREARERMGNLEQVLQEQREGARQLELRLSNRGNHHEHRIKDLDYAFNMHLKETLEKEVVELRASNKDQQDKIRQAEEKELLLSTQVAVLSKQQNNHDRQITLMKAKQRETEANAQGQKHRYYESEENLRRCNQELKEVKEAHRSAAKAQTELERKVEEQAQTVNGKSKVIRQLQGQLQEAMVKAERSERVGAQNAKLRNELDTIQRQHVLRASKGMLSPTSSAKELNRQESTGIIQRLGQENQNLKEELADVLKTMGTLSPNRQPSAQLQERLNDFNNRLQMAIGGQGNHQLGKSPSQQSVGWEREKAQLVEHYEAELRRLKGQQGLGGSQVSQNKLSSSAAGWIGSLESERLKDEVSFLRDRNSEQQQRNTQLIKVNEQLQRKIDSVLKGRQGNPALDYYKEQCDRFEKENEGLKGRVKQLGEECRGYRLELATKNTKMSQEYEFKVLQLEIAVQQQQRRIVFLESERATGEDASSVSERKGAGGVVTSRAVEQSKVRRVEQVSSKEYTPMQQEFYSVVGVGGADSRAGAVSMHGSSPRSKHNYSQINKY